MLDDGASFFVYSFFYTVAWCHDVLTMSFGGFLAKFVVHLHWLDAMEGQKIVGSCS